MRLNLAPACEDDLVAILKNPWQLTYQEFENFQLWDRYPVHQLASLLLAETHGTATTARTEGGVLIAAMGAQRVNERDWVLWVIRSADFPGQERALDRAHLQLMQQHAERIKAEGAEECRAVIVTSIVTEAVDRWARLLGFSRFENDVIKSLYSCETRLYERLL